MLTLALAATLVGFVLLILGLITDQVWLAVACIVICLIGLVFLLIDVIGSGRRRDGGRTIEDMVPGASGETDDRERDDRETGDRELHDREIADRADHEGDAHGGPAERRETREAVGLGGATAAASTARFGAPGGFSPGAGDSAGPHSGRHAALGADAETEGRASGYPAPPSSTDDRSGSMPGRSGVAPYESRYAQQDTRRDGDLDDYLRSVGGSDSGGNSSDTPDDTPNADAARGGGSRPSWAPRPPDGPAQPGRPGEQSGPRQYSAQQAPGQQQYPGQQRPEGQPYPAPQSGSGWRDASGGPTSDDRRADDSAGERGGSRGSDSEPAAEKFDPLDPRWRPPMD